MRIGTASTLILALAIAACTRHPDPAGAMPAPVNIAGDPAVWLAPPPGGSLAQCQPVRPVLVREIPPEAEAQAAADLSATAVTPLDMSRVKQLLPASFLDRLTQAETSAIDAEDEANRREVIANDPVLSTPTYRQEAEAHRIAAANMRDEQTTLRPYLVRAVAARDAAGGFAVCEAGSTLSVTHVSSIGGAGPALRFKPLIVLLPSAPTGVYVDTAAARS